MKDKIQNTIKCCLGNIVVSVLALTALYISKYNLHTDPVILVGMLIVYLELSKLLYLVATGIDVPIFLRYLMASVAAGMAVKFYISAIDKDLEWMFYYALATVVFLLIRWLSIWTTKSIR